MGYGTKEKDGKGRETRDFRSNKRRPTAKRQTFTGGRQIRPPAFYRSRTDSQCAVNDTGFAVHHVEQDCCLAQTFGGAQHQYAAGLQGRMQTAEDVLFELS